MIIKTYPKSLKTFIVLSFHVLYQIYFTSKKARSIITKKDDFWKTLSIITKRKKFVGDKNSWFFSLFFSKNAKDYSFILISNFYWYYIFYVFIFITLFFKKKLHLIALFLIFFRIYHFNYFILKNYTITLYF